MTFVNEYISEEDKKKFGHTYRWTIDRDRGFFLISSGMLRENRREFELYNFTDGKIVLRAGGYDKSSGNPRDGVLEWYDIHNLVIVESMRGREREMINILTEALAEFGLGMPNEKIKNCTVKITFNDK